MPSRFKESFGLFGSECGSGTTSPFTCGFCKNPHNEEANEVGHHIHSDSVSFTEFAGLTVCYDCFGLIEDEILRRMPDILVWYAEILSTREAVLKKVQAELSKVAEIIAKG